MTCGEWVLTDTLMTKNFIPMFKMNFKGVFTVALALFVAGSLTVSCYDDSDLRASIDDLKSQLSQLQTLVTTLQNDDTVVGVTHNPDGSYTIKFKNSGDVTIKNGKDGKDGAIDFVMKGEDNYTFYFGDGSYIILPRDYELHLLTFEDADYRGPVDILNYWTSMIDSEQYGGELLYGKGCTWADENNTFLSGCVLPYDAASWTGGFSSGGIAISNYGNTSFEEADYTRQLEVFVPSINEEFYAAREYCGNNGSDNFAVIYDAGSWEGANPAELTMCDGVARLIESAYVNITNYTLNVLVNGNSQAVPMAENGFYKITATGFNGEEPTGSVDYYLARNHATPGAWVCWNLIKLGFVDKVVFSVSGSPEQYGSWGFNTPAYFAIDDIAVRVFAE